MPFDPPEPPALPRPSGGGCVIYLFILIVVLIIAYGITRLE